MAKKKIDKLKSAKRFGPRYGRRVKSRFVAIEQEQRKKHKCPYCSNIAVKRIAAGIWNCKKCNAKFTGRAYTLAKRIILKEDIKGESVEEVEDEENSSGEEASAEEEPEGKSDKEKLSEKKDKDEDKKW